MLDMRQLRYFAAIVEHGSFSRAAEALRIAQPSLSLHVRNMEAALGTPLLFRTARGVTPTEAGSILLRHARVILGQLTAAEEEIRGHDSDPAGEVRLGLPGTISQILAVPLIRETHRRHPRIKLRIAEAMSGFVLEWMREGRIDLAVLYGEARDHGLQTERVLDEDLHFFGPPAMADDDGLPPGGSDIGFGRLMDLPLILPGNGHGLRDLLRRYADHGDLSLNTVIDVDSYSNIKALVIDGMGYSILPPNAIAAELGRGQLRAWTICDPQIRRSVHLTHATDRPQTNAVCAVLALARDTLIDLSRTGQWAGTRLVTPEKDTP